jgi:Secretion system C-terminal sorting domain
MKNHSILFILLTFFSFNSFSQVNLNWASSLGGNSSDGGKLIKTDFIGNVYVSGQFKGTADFDPSSNVFNLSYTGNFNGNFLTKLDSLGNFKWAKKLDSNLVVNSFVVDHKSNLLITGSFAGTADFDPSTSTSNLTSNGSKDAFILKLDSNGIFVWAKKMGSTGDDGANCITLDLLENIFTTGYFEGTSDFDPNSGTSNLVSLGSKDIFVSKLDSSGNFLLAKSMGLYGSDVALEIAIDNQNNILTVGAFNSTIDFDPSNSSTNLTPLGTKDVFISKLNASGNFVWAKQFGGTNYASSPLIEIDSFDNYYISGDFNGTIDFDPSSGIFNLTNSNSSNVFITKLNSLGNFIWAKQFGGSIYSSALDKFGCIYSIGNFGGTTDFDPGNGICNLTSVGNITGDIFISKLDSSGSFEWAKNFGNTSYFTQGSSISINSKNQIFTTGSYAISIDFDPSPNIYTLNSASGTSDVFVQKLSQGKPDIPIFSQVNSSANLLTPCAYGQTLKSKILNPDGLIEIKLDGVVISYNYYDSSFSYSAGAPGTHTLSVSYSNFYGTVINDTTFTTLSIPTILVTLNPAFSCQGSSITINASGANTYNLSPPATNGVAFVPTSQVYTVTGTGTNNCINSTTVFVGTTYTSSAGFNITPSTYYASIGDPLTFTASISNSVIPPYAISWYKNNVLQVITTTPIWNTNKTAGQFYITAKINSTHQCFYLNSDTSQLRIINPFPANISKSQFANLTISPNPVLSNLYISGLSISDQICLIDIYGKEVFLNTSVKSDTEIVNLENFSSGIYIFQIKRDGNLFRKMIIKK